MNRREFVCMGGIASTAAVAERLVSAQIAQQPSGPTTRTAAKAQMKAGTQHGDSDEILRAMAGFGVVHICSRLPSERFDAEWSVEGLTRLRERVESFGVTLDMVPLPLSSSEISRSENPAVLLASAERDRQIDDICQMIRNTARAGIPDTELTAAGRVDADTYWERITYFLKRVVPVAEEYKVKIACHPQDPGMPKGRGWRGIETVLGSVDGLKRFVSIAESPYHGLNFCQGTVSEMLDKPGDQIFDVIRYFGSRRKIFNVHFRNIAGGFLNFVPSIQGDANSFQGFAFALGYIKALIAAVAAES